ncbi:hypothetical protein [Luteimonas kalidii]|uniref:Uncharacterized protein n=1 Tax=Luteimonas kalidii TaxID=3042025 RepID=A0ABT6JTA4_9GAMM|nr:hypothetical protein [Luteimonas kalidii]MDH5833700.1 hypothetical protein [Luteimonas kalidii]
MKAALIGITIVAGLLAALLVASKLTSPYAMGEFWNGVGFGFRFYFQVAVCSGGVYFGTNIAYYFRAGAPASRGIRLLAYLASAALCVLVALVFAGYDRVFDLGLFWKALCLLLPATIVATLIGLEINEPGEAWKGWT